MTDVRGRALVLGGGGVAGISWLLGIIDGLRGEGIDLGSADLLVGTSAGACVGTQLATGALAEAIAMQRLQDSAEIDVELDLAEYLSRMQAATDGARDERDAARRVAHLETATTVVVDPERRRSAVAARLPVKEWPEHQLVITAVDRQTGELMGFRRESGVPLVSAVTASCALPGVWPPVAINGRDYVDGGARSATNADLARGYETVVVLAPLAPTENLNAKLRRELSEVDPPRAHVAQPDERSVTAIGPNPLSPVRRAAALDAGIEQARREAKAVARVWRTPSL